MRVFTTNSNEGNGTQNCVPFFFFIKKVLTSKYNGAILYIQQTKGLIKWQTKKITFCA